MEGATFLCLPIRSVTPQRTHTSLSPPLQCDKFVDAAEFEEAQRTAGPGKQMCQGCEEIACMGF